MESYVIERTSLVYLQIGILCTCKKMIMPLDGVFSPSIGRIIIPPDGDFSPSTGRIIMPLDGVFSASTEKCMIISYLCRPLKTGPSLGEVSRQGILTIKF